MIDLHPALNPARYPALIQAQNRANREKKACAVYVAGPYAKSSFAPDARNTWYVRLVDEPAPEGATLFETVFPVATRAF